MFRSVCVLSVCVCVCIMFTCCSIQTIRLKFWWGRARCKHMASLSFNGLHCAMCGCVLWVFKPYANTVSNSYRASGWSAFCRPWEVFRCVRLQQEVVFPCLTHVSSTLRAAFQSESSRVQYTLSSFMFWLREGTLILARRHANTTHNTVYTTINDATSHTHTRFVYNQGKRLYHYCEFYGKFC